MQASDRAFQKRVWAHYRKNGRYTLPWRQTRDPYKILVSEVMLQQTQVDRVLPKYKQFLKRFPSVRALRNAPLGDVLRQWQGLGYNRRARMLHEAAKAIVHEHNGRFPKEQAALEALPGIGPYTAAAVRAFAFNEAVVLIETNIRTVFLHRYFSDASDIADADITPLVERTLDRAQPREWYWALMDYGSHIKRTRGNQNSRSKHYTKQSKFKGSDRQIRGVILRLLATNEQLTRRMLHGHLSSFEDVRVDAQLERLIEEALIEKRRRHYALPE